MADQSFLFQMIFENFHFFRGVGVKNLNSKFAQNLVFLYLEKVKKFEMNISLC